MPHASGSPTPPGSGAPADRAPVSRFGPDRSAVFAVLVFAVCALPVALSSPWALLVLLLPLACLVWVLRARVVVRPDGLEVSNGLGVRRVPWDRVEGFDVPRRGPVRLLADGRRLPMTGLARRRVRELVRVGEQVQGRGR